MNLDSSFFGPQEFNAEDREYKGSRYAEVREALFRDRYYLVWGAPGSPPLPTYEVTLRRALAGILRRKWHFQNAAVRTVESTADMRWGPDGRGFRRILHPNGVCLFGRWIIDATPPGSSYTGYFEKGKIGRVIARYSTCCTETRRGHYRSLAMVGNIFPTDDPNHAELLRPASFITQQDFGGEMTEYINDAELRNAPNTTPWRRGTGILTFLLTGLVLLRADRRPAVRQLYRVAELGKPGETRTNTPLFMRLKPSAGQPYANGEQLDFRDEILAHIYDAGDPVKKRLLSFDIDVSDHGEAHGIGFQRQTVSGWQRIGRIEFDEAAASYSGDFVFHAPHPPWRSDPNDPRTVARTNRPL